MTLAPKSKFEEFAAANDLEPGAAPTIPHDADAERALIAVFLRSTDSTAKLCTAKGIYRPHFFQPFTATLYDELMFLWGEKMECDVVTLLAHLRDSGRLEMSGGEQNVRELFQMDVDVAQATHYLDIIERKYVARRAIDFATRFADRFRQPHDSVEGLLAEFHARAAEIQLGSKRTRIDVMGVLNARRARLHSPPPEPVIVWRLGASAIASSGNILAIQAKIKAGKSAFIGALIASTASDIGDFFGLSSENPNGDVLLHFDTEQSPYDHAMGYKRALQRAGRMDEPEWIESYCITDLSIEDRITVIHERIRIIREAKRKILGIVIDGVADLCLDVNDPKESNALVLEFHKMAIDNNTVVVGVIHENAGATNKTRGHLGSQLERKAETNLKLEKDAQGVTVIYSDRARHAHIAKEYGFKFEWSDEKKMHVSTGAQFTPDGKPAKDPDAPRKNAKVTSAKASLGQFFALGANQRRSKLKTKLVVEKAMTARTFDNYWQELKDGKWIKEVRGITGLFEAAPAWASDLASDYPAEDDES